MDADIINLKKLLIDPVNSEISAPVKIVAEFDCLPMEIQL